MKYAAIDLITSGDGSVLYGTLRPLSFAVLALVAFYSPQLKHHGRLPMVFGSLGNMSAALVFLFVNADASLPDAVIDFAEIVSTPSIVLFTFGFVKAAIRVGGLKVGRNG